MHFVLPSLSANQKQPVHGVDALLIPGLRSLRSARNHSLQSRCSVYDQTIAICDALQYFMRARAPRGRMQRRCLPGPPCRATRNIMSDGWCPGGHQATPRQERAPGRNLAATRENIKDRCFHSFLASPTGPRVGGLVRHEDLSSDSLMGRVFFRIAPLPRGGAGICRSFGSGSHSAISTADENLRGDRCD